VSRQTSETLRVGRQLVEITRPNKVLFPADGITKRELAEYYRQVAPIILPHLRGRPLALERYPEGIGGPGFFQQEAGAYFPRWIRTASLPKQGGSVRHVICGNGATLVYLAGQAVITPHAWLSRVDKPNNPDQMIFDLDPSDGDFKAVCGAAKKLRELLAEYGLPAFVKTTGSRGLHVLVPLDRRADFDRIRAFARQIARRLAQADPEHLTTDARKTKRRGRIFIDTARNSYAQTAAPPYAVRAREGAPVAVPLHWEELDNPQARADQFTIRNIWQRLHSIGDPWKSLRGPTRKALDLRALL
jgi:bifunctional non-homologous end joining protein LigD